MVVGAGPTATRYRSSNAWSVSIFGIKSGRTLDPIDAVPRTDHQHVLDWCIHHRHRDVRDDYLPALVHAGRDGRYRDPIGQSSDPDAPRYGGRDVYVWTGNHATPEL